MKKLALIKKDFHSMGGLEKVTSRLLDAWLSKGIDVTLFTTSSSPAHWNHGDDPSDAMHNRRPKIDCYKPKGLLKSQKLRDFDQWISHTTSLSSFDVIFSMDRCSTQTHHRAGNGVHAAYLDQRAHLKGYLRKWSFALNPLHRTQLQLERQTFESPDTQVIIVNSTMVQKQILRYYNTPAQKIHVIYNGVEWRELESDFNDSMRHRKEQAVHLGLDPSVFQFLFVGHNFERKGLAAVLKSLSLVSDKNFHLSIVGHDKKMAFYRMLATRLGLESQVTFFGAQPSCKPFYLASDALVIPSMYDPFANATIEALALGVFVVTSKMNGGHEILHPFSGIAIENSQNVDELTAALQQALRHPKEKQQATLIRSSVAHLDYPFQLDKICQLCLG